MKKNKIHDDNRLSEDEFLDMANLTEKHTGISNIILWVEPNPEEYWMRIKVSNIPNNEKNAI